MNKIILLFALFSLIFIYNYSKSQNRQIADSLILLLKDEDFDEEERINVYLEIARNGLPQESLEYAQKALELSENIGNKLYIARSLEEISLNHRVLGNKVASFNASFEALKIYDELNLIDRQAAIYAQLGVIYIDNQNFIDGIASLSRSLQFYEELKDSDKIVTLNINLGEAYRIIDNRDSAKICFEKSLKINKQVKDDLLFAYAVGNLGMIHALEGELDKAKTELKQAINILEPLGDPYSVSVYESELANILISEGNGIEGEQLLLKSLDVAKREGLKEQICDISKKLSVYYETIGNFRNALKYRQDFEVYQDSILSYENVRKIEQLKSEYEMEKKETEIDFLNETNKIQKKVEFFLGLGVLLFIVLTFLLFRLYKKTRKTNILLEEQKKIIQEREEEKALLLKELNHRVKNNLQMISSLLNLQSHQLKGHPAAESLKAVKYRVEALSLVHQKLYREDYHSKISLNEYIEELVMNLVYCFNKKVDLRMNLNHIDVDIDSAIPLGLIINELVTNSLKYAFESNSNPVLEIELKKSNNEILLSIADNGKGLFDKGSEEKSNSFGLKLVKSLLKQLNGNLENTNKNGCRWEISILS